MAKDFTLSKPVPTFHGEQAFPTPIRHRNAGGAPTRSAVAR